MQVSPRLQKLFHLLLEACAGIFISLLILAILPLLIQKVSQHSHKNLLELSQLIPLNQEELIPDEPPEQELPDPPEPEMEPPDPPEPEMEPPDMSSEAIDDMAEVSAIALNVEMAPLATGNLTVSVRMEAPNLKQLAPPKLSHPALNNRAFDMKEVDRQPQYLSSMQPPYPYKARRMGIEGYVDVRFLVDKNGLPHKLSILEAKPEGEFEDTVKKTVPHWKFKPGQKNGRPVDTWVKTRILFQLN